MKAELIAPRRRVEQAARRGRRRCPETLTKWSSPARAERRAHLRLLGAVDVDRRRVGLLDPLGPLAVLVADADLDRGASRPRGRPGRTRAGPRPAGRSSARALASSLLGGPGQCGPRRRGHALHPGQPALEVDRAGRVRAQREGRDRHPGESGMTSVMTASSLVRIVLYRNTAWTLVFLCLCLPIPSLNRCLMTTKFMRRLTRAHNRALPARHGRGRRPGSWSRSAGRATRRPYYVTGAAGRRQPGLRGRGGRARSGWSMDGVTQPAPLPRHQRRRARTGDGGGGECGMFSMALAPDYATSGLFYVFYTRDAAGPEHDLRDRGVPPLDRQPERHRRGHRPRTCW